MLRINLYIFLCCTYSAINGFTGKYVTPNRRPFLRMTLLSPANDNDNGPMNGIASIAARIMSMVDLSDPSITTASVVEGLKVDSLDDETLKNYTLVMSRHMNSRIHALNILLSRPHIKLSFGETKVLMVAAIFTKSESIVEATMQRFRDHGQLTSELLAVGIRTAHRRRLARLAYLLVMEAQKNPTVITDIESINVVLGLLAINWKVEECWNILSLAANGSFGSHVTPDLDTFHYVIDCASKARDSATLVKCFKLLHSNPTQVDPSLNLDSLKFCALSGFYEAAREIMIAFLQSHRPIRQQAYALVIMAYNVFRLDNVDTESGVRVGKDPLADILATMDTRMSTKDPYPELFNQVLQYYCIENQVETAYEYFHRMIASNSSWSFSSTSLLMYSNLLKRNKAAKKMITFAQYMRSQRLESSLLLARILGNRKPLFEDIDEAFTVLKRSLASNNFKKVKTEYIYYLLAEAIQARRFSSVVNFFRDFVGAFQSAENLSDLFVFAGTVELIMCRVPFRYAFKIIPDALKMYATVTESVYSEQKERRMLRGAQENNESSVITTDPYSRVKLPMYVSLQDLNHTAFLNFNYLVMISALFAEGQFESVFRITPLLSISKSDPASEKLLVDLVESVLSSSINIDCMPISLDNVSPTTVNEKQPVSFDQSWSRYLDALLQFVIDLRKGGYKPSDALYTLLISGLCDPNRRIPYAPSLASYTGEFELPSIKDIPTKRLPTQLFVDMVEQDGLQPSLALHEAILKGYFGSMNHSSPNVNGIEYFTSLHPWVIELMDAELRSTCVSFLKGIESSTMVMADGDQFPADYSDPKGKLQASLLKNTGNSMSTFRDNSTSINLYNRVFETLLRANRSQDAKSLLQIMLAKNISTKPDEVYVLMGHEIKANNPKGAVEVFTAFFHMPNSAPPDSRSVSLLAVALSKLKKPDLGYSLADEILPHILHQKLQLSIPVCETFFSFCMTKKNATAAVEYLALIPSMQRKLTLMLALTKLCAINGQVELLGKLVCPFSYPFEVICHNIAAFSLRGMWKKALHLEYVLNKAATQRGLQVPPWVRTFLLYSTAMSGKWDNAQHIITVPDLTLSELDMNLALYSGLKHIRDGGMQDDSPAAKVKKVTDLLSLLGRMREESQRVHRACLVLVDTMAKRGSTVPMDDIVAELTLFATCDNPIASEDVPFPLENVVVGGGNITTSSTKATRAQYVFYSKTEIESMRLMDSPYLIKSKIPFGLSRGN